MNVACNDRLILLTLPEYTHYLVKRKCDIPVIAGYGTASLCDKFPMFGESVVVSKREASITKWRGDISI